MFLLCKYLCLYKVNHTVYMVGMGSLRNVDQLMSNLEILATPASFLTMYGLTLGNHAHESDEYPVRCSVVFFMFGTFFTPDMVSVTTE